MFQVVQASETDSGRPLLCRDIFRGVQLSEMKVGTTQRHVQQPWTATFLTHGAVGDTFLNGVISAELCGEDEH